VHREKSFRDDLNFSRKKYYGSDKIYLKLTKNTHGVVFAFQLVEISKFCNRKICSDSLINPTH
jgi:hypothetical protein